MYSMDQAIISSKQTLDTIKEQNRNINGQTEAKCTNPVFKLELLQKRALNSEGQTERRAKVGKRFT